MSNLSPAAKAVLDAANDCSTHGPDDCLNESRWIAAGALCAAADQLLAVQLNGQIPAGTEYQLGINWARSALYVLANELEGQ